ncbi:SacI homology domain-containing protein [Zychaea mexicana]|uniref:Sac phosphatase domain-containing protein n=1 Tax=Zychaea mexicana TaxID=64656 RepID=UPI0022FF44C0|nr:Sac phosphatase domain-containing protein [Zychaea mexicana]KAI9489823.1 SacI homology domain-containing protein [Zychaea mexicana]
MHQKIRLYITKDTYVLEPESGASLIVRRKSGTVELGADNAVPPVTEQETAMSISGIMGFIQLQAYLGYYMIVITNSETIGSIRGHDIHRVGSFQILPLARNLAGLTEIQKQDEHTYVRLLENHLKSGGFYFSYTYDLTQSLQRQGEFNNDSLTEPLWKRVDDRFFWNRYISSKLIDAILTKDASQNFTDYILPVMQGFVNIENVHVNDKKFVLGLITRRSRFRPGTRFFSRGIDSDGHVSNFVETEQLVLYDGPDAPSPIVGKKQLSYVQTRGSIPVYWSQIINLKYTPRLWVGESRKSLAAARSHFDEQIRTYGPQILVNLINKKGYELPMGQAYARTVEQLNDPRLYYTHFDFHSECKKMRWDRIQLLVDQLQEQLVKQGYFYYDASDKNAPVIRKSQESVIRSNCMDCLDRTNVVQSTFARWVLTQQLRQIEILGPNESIEKHADFMFVYRNVWADNADAVSTTYSGTGALKTDFTRTGQRTKQGALQDLSNSLTRYVKNNFLDGKRQDGFDLILGNYEVQPASTAGTVAISSEKQQYISPFASNRPLRVRVVPSILVFGLFMLLLNLLRPGYSGVQSWLSYLMLLAFWLSVVVSGVRFAIRHGNQFVEWPHLVHQPDYDQFEAMGGVMEKGSNLPPESGLAPQRLE